IPVQLAKTTSDWQLKTSAAAIHWKTTASYSSFAPITCFCNSFAGSFSFPAGFIFFALATRLHRNLRPCHSVSRCSPSCRSEISRRSPKSQTCRGGSNPRPLATRQPENLQTRTQTI
ncbi:hypothetical protein U1Q18_008009, partial [Sarracenia purpurea var. burkii]